VGGGGVINFQVANFLRTGQTDGQISLQFWDGYGTKANYEKSFALVPDEFTDHIDILVPNFAGELKANGSFGYRFTSAEIPSYLVGLGRSKGAAVVPMVLGSGTVANQMLLDPAKRRNFINSAVKLVQETQSDGIMADLESLATNTGPGLTALMKDLYAALHPQGKLVMIAVMSKTSDSAEPWYRQFSYSDLAKYADYIQIMSYDFSYSNSAPGPIAPLDWVKKVMAYATTQIPSQKLLLGMPSYGRTWSKSGTAWKSAPFSLTGATQTAAAYGAAIARETTATDPVGIPTFKYLDEKGGQWTAYYDDCQSWSEKLKLVDKYNLGGAGCWSMHWLDEGSAPELYSLLKEGPGS